MKTIEEIWSQLRQGIPVGHTPVIVPRITHHRNIMTIEKSRTPGKSTSIPVVLDTNFTLEAARQCIKIATQPGRHASLIQRYTQQRNWIRFQLRSKTKKGPKRKAF
jgi:hypothetical protein